MPAVAAAVCLVRDGRADGPIVEIRMRSDARGTRVWFDPIGLLLDHTE